MRRDYFTLEVRNVGDGVAERPAVDVTFDGPTDAFEQRLTGDEDVDVTFRFQPEGDDDRGVFGVTDRMTGDFILEVNVQADDILSLIDGAQTYAQATNDADGCYGITLRQDDSVLYRTEKRTLLVYDEDGSLLRHHSLIPSGVEL